MEKKRKKSEHNHRVKIHSWIEIFLKGFKMRGVTRVHLVLLVSVSHFTVEMCYFLI